MFLASRDVDRILGQLGALGHDRAGPFGDPAELNDALREQVHVLVGGSVNLVEQFVQRDEVGPFHVPVRLLRLELEVDRVGQSLVQQVDHLTTGGFGDVVEGWVGDARHGGTPVSGG